MLLQKILVCILEKKRKEQSEKEKIHSKEVGRKLRLRQVLSNIECSELHDALSTKGTTAEEVYAWTSDDLTMLGISFFKRGKVLKKIKLQKGKFI